MKDAGEAPSRRGYAGPLLLLVTLVWIFGTCALLLKGLTAGPLFDANVPAERQRAIDHAQAKWAAAALLCWVTAPLLGLVVAVAARRTVARWVWGVLLCGAALTALILVAGDPGHREWHELFPASTPTPEPTHCVVFSGGTNTCPGG